MNTCKIIGLLLVDPCTFQAFYKYDADNGRALQKVRELKILV
jgi:hypothetical protein